MGWEKTLGFLLGFMIGFFVIFLIIYLQPLESPPLIYEQF